MTTKLPQQDSKPDPSDVISEETTEETNPLIKLTTDLIGESIFVKDKEDREISMPDRILELVEVNHGMTGAEVADRFPVTIMRDVIHAALKRLVVKNKLGRIKTDKGYWYFIRRE